MEMATSTGMVMTTSLSVLRGIGNVNLQILDLCILFMERKIRIGEKLFYSPTMLILK